MVQFTERRIYMTKIYGQVCWDGRQRKKNGLQRTLNDCSVAQVPTASF